MPLSAAQTSGCHCLRFLLCRLHLRRGLTLHSRRSKLPPATRRSSLRVAAASRTLLRLIKPGGRCDPWVMRVECQACVCEEALPAHSGNNSFRKVVPLLFSAIAWHSVSAVPSPARSADLVRQSRRALRRSTPASSCIALVASAPLPWWLQRAQQRALAHHRERKLVLPWRCCPGTLLSRSRRHHWRQVPRHTHACVSSTLLVGTPWSKTTLVGTASTEAWRAGGTASKSASARTIQPGDK